MAYGSRFVARSDVDASAAELYEWHLRPAAFDRLTPAWEPVQVIERSAATIGPGSEVVLLLRAGPLRMRWVALHEGFEPGRQFVDIQRSGPMGSWRHVHRFVPRQDGRALLEDAIDYRLPLGFVGKLVGGRHTQRKLQRLFTHRHAITRLDLQRAATAPGTALHVAISGASGLVGSSFSAFLSAAGHRVSRLVRRTPAEADEIRFDPDGGRIDASRLEGVDAVVHLAGENIAAGRWSPERKRRIRDSRVSGTRLLAESLASLQQPPRVLVNASAIGFYGDRGEERLDESSLPGDGFLSRTCVDWEQATAPAEQAGLRVVKLRIGLVLSAGGGALPRMVTPFRAGLGGPVGDGRQYWSFISLEDLIGVLFHVIVRPEIEGPVNAVAPTPVRNREFTRTLATVLRRPAILPLPGAIISLLMGEMGRELLLGSSRVEPRRLVESGFRFRSAELESALRFELGRFGSDWPGPRFELEDRHRENAVR